MHNGLIIIHLYIIISDNRSSSDKLNRTLKYTLPHNSVSNMIVILGGAKFHIITNQTVLGWKAFIHKTGVPWQIQSWRRFITRNGIWSQLLTETKPFKSNKLGWITHMLPLEEQFYIRDGDYIAIRVDNAMPLYEYACGEESVSLKNHVLNLKDIPMKIESIQPGMIIGGFWDSTPCIMYSFKLITRIQNKCKLTM